MPAVDRRPTLLVLRALGLGDLLTAVPALRGLAAAFPDHRRVLAMPAALAPLADLVGAVDEVLDHRGLAPLPSMPPPDVAVDLHGRGPQSHRLLLAARPRRLVAFGHEAVPESRGLPEWRADEHEVARWCRLLGESGIPCDPDDLGLPTPPVEVPPAHRGATVLHPGASAAARRWPAARWAQVARHERAQGHHVVVTGGPDEVDLARTVAAEGGLAPSAVQAGTGDVLALAATVAAAGRVVCGDTGVAHLATALAIPSVVLFGPTPPDHWGPPPDRPAHVVLWSGGTGDPGADRPDPGLLRITVQEVCTALDHLAPRAISEQRV